MALAPFLSEQDELNIKVYCTTVLNEVATRVLIGLGAVYTLEN